MDEAKERAGNCSLKINFGDRKQLLYGKPINPNWSSFYTLNKSLASCKKQSLKKKIVPQSTKSIAFIYNFLLYIPPT